MQHVCSVLMSNGSTIVDMSIYSDVHLSASRISLHRQAFFVKLGGRIPSTQALYVGGPGFNPFSPSLLTFSPLLYIKDTLGQFETGRGR